MTAKTPPKRRNAAAQALQAPSYRQQKIKPLKGKGSYKRRPKHRDGVSVFGFGPAQLNLAESGLAWLV